MARFKKLRGFSLVELVIVIVIIGVIAAIAVPRISRGAAGAGAAGLRGDLHVMRQAIDLYAAEHAGTFPPILTFGAVLTQYTDDAHAPVALKDATHIYGPYLVAVPKLKVGDGKGENGVAASAGAGIGWIYTEANGLLVPNSGTATDESGIAFNTY